MTPQSRQAHACAPRSPRVRAAAVVCAVVGVLLPVTGCGKDESSVTSARATQAASPSASPSLSAERTRRKELVESAKITWDKAADTAVGEVAQSKLVDLELERGPRSPSQRPSGTATGSPRPSASPSAPQWTAVVAVQDGTAHVVTIDAVSGKVTESRLEQDQDADDKQELAGLLAQATQTPEQAVKKATDEQSGTVTAVQLGDSDGNTTVWEVEVANTGDWTETDFEIDAAQGTVVRERVDNG